MQKWKTDHLQRFGSLRTANRLARDIGESVSVVLEYCRCNNLCKEVPHTYLNERVKRFVKVEPVTRPPAVYDNKSWEDNINEILSR
jgi:hypothetical protein